MVKSGDQWWEFLFKVSFVPFLGGGLDRGRSPVEWRDFPFVPPGWLALRPAWLALKPAWLALRPAWLAPRPDWLGLRPVWVALGPSRGDG